MGYILELPIPFDILDAAVAANLSYFPDGVVEFMREPITSSSAVYHLRQEELGDVGEIRLRKLIEDKSELYVKESLKSPPQEYTEEERTTLRSVIGRDNKVAAITELNRKMADERDDQHHRKVRHLHDVVNGLMQRLQRDSIWPQKPMEEYYRNGLDRLVKLIDKGDQRYTEVLVYQQRLLENINHSQRYGHTNTSKSERAEIIDRLNNITRSTLDVTFLELCSGAEAKQINLESHGN